MIPYANKTRIFKFVKVSGLISVFLVLWMFI